MLILLFIVINVVECAIFYQSKNDGIALQKVNM